MNKIFLFLMIVCFLFNQAMAEALHFGADVTHAKWEVTGSKEECRLAQRVRDFGILSFVHRAGRSVHYRVHSWHDARVGMEGKLSLLPPTWRHDAKPESLAKVPLKQGRTLLELDTYQTQKLVIALEKGFIVRLVYPLKPKPREHTFTVDASTVNFRERYDKFQACVEQLLPYDFEEIAFMSVFFDSESMALSKQSEKTLKKIIHYISAGAKLSRVVISGYSDKRGRYHYNRKIARARAEAVRSYFIIHEVPKDLLFIEDTTRRGGYTFSNELSDKENRRVTIRLVHE